MSPPTFASSPPSSPPLPHRKKVVIIGGGVIGSSVAYHLNKKGWGEDVILLERALLTSGTTWHAAGLIGQLRGSEEETRLSKYGSKLYSSLEEETGYDTGFRQCGSLTLATCPERMEQLKMTSSRATSFEIGNEMWSKEQIKERYPLLRTDDILGGLYLPEDGTATSSDCTMAMIAGARQGGVTVSQGYEVVDFIKDESGSVPKVTGVVVSPRGNPNERFVIDCDVVVNCCGQWAREVGRLAGVNVPLYSAQHYYIVTKPITASITSSHPEKEMWGSSRGVNGEKIMQEGGVSGWLPVLRDPDASLYVREWSGGLLVGCFEMHAKPAYGEGEKIPTDTEFDLFNFDWDHFAPIMEDAMHRLPVLEDVEVRDTVNGPESFTADNRYILGEAPTLKDFYVAAGFNSSGIASAPGAGKTMAEWITTGSPERDIWAVDLRRFSKFHGNTKFLRHRVVESLGLHYSIAWPRYEASTGRGGRRSPLFPYLQKHGAFFGNSNGWERALYFSPSTTTTPSPPSPPFPSFPSPGYSFTQPPWLKKAGEEHVHTREAVSLFDQTSLSKYLIQGKGAEEFLEWVCCNQIGEEKPGPGNKVVYSLLLNERGNIEGEVTITKLEDQKYLVMSGSTQTTRDLDWLGKQLSSSKFRDSVTITDYSSSLAILGVMGPLSRELMAFVSPTTDFSNSAFPYYRSQEIELGYATAQANRMSYVGELGWELYLPSEMAPVAYEHIWEEAQKRDINLRNCGYYSLDSLRIEKGHPAWGRDISANNNPLETKQMFCVKLKSEIDFLGRKSLLSLKQTRDERDRQQLFTFKFQDSDVFPVGGECVFRNNEMRGYLSSVAWCQTAGRAIGLGMVKINRGETEKEAKEKGEWRVQTLQGLSQVHIQTGGYYDPNNVKVKS